MKYLKEIKKSVLLTDLIYIVIGTVMMIIPGFISNFICYVLGALIIFYGSLKIIKYRELKEHNSLSSIMLIMGVLAFILGLIIIINPEAFASIVPIIIGIYIMIISLSKFNQAIEFKNSNYSKWPAVLIAAILLLSLGIIITFKPFETLTLILRVVGIVFIINSLYDIYNVYSYQKDFKDLKKDFKDILK